MSPQNLLSRSLLFRIIDALMCRIIVSIPIQHDPIIALFGCGHQTRGCSCRPEPRQLTIRLDWHGYHSSSLPTDSEFSLSSSTELLNGRNNQHHLAMAFVCATVKWPLDVLTFEIDLEDTPEPILDTLPDSFKFLRRNSLIPAMTWPICRTLVFQWRRSKSVHGNCDVKTGDLLNSIVSVIVNNNPDAQQPEDTTNCPKQNIETLLRCKVVNSEWDLY